MERQREHWAYGADLSPGGRALAPYAASRLPSRGRLHREPDCPTRTPLQRDRDRVLHSTAFRRLTYKTQVFVFHEGDHYRNRLTHSLEVAQIARGIARQLCLDEDLAEALSLAHDLGHPPFGHAGERALDAALGEAGGFDHNVQSFRIVARLERKYAGFDGLNLTWETLEGLVKHNGPPMGSDRPGDGTLVHAVRRFQQQMDLALDAWPSAEAQAAALADEIAWMTHDIDDGLRAGLIAFDDLRVPDLLQPIVEEVERMPAIDGSRRIYGVTRQVITVLMADAVRESRSRLAGLAPGSPDDIRRAGGPVIAFSGPTADAARRLKAFLFARLYRHQRVVAVMGRAEVIVRDLVARYRQDPGAMPAQWLAEAAMLEPRRRARLIGDFVAGMTDRFAVSEHRRLFDATPELR
ncbi:MAG: deoxyguanosinetriphosphate triphosphohydrolase [Hyphomicrobiaceae bacterium]|nr:deoxyguanosinetriphosphate triphosphohydrolase [Hyphomicrobiaceae bacterium]